MFRVDALVNNITARILIAPYVAWNHSFKFQVRLLHTFHNVLNLDLGDGSFACTTQADLPGIPFNLSKIFTFDVEKLVFLEMVKCSSI